MTKAFSPGLPHRLPRDDQTQWGRNLPNQNNARSGRQKRSPAAQRSPQQPGRGTTRFPRQRRPGRDRRNRTQALGNQTGLRSEPGRQRQPPGSAQLGASRRTEPTKQVPAWRSADFSFFPKTNLDFASPCC